MERMWKNTDEDILTVDERFLRILAEKDAEDKINYELCRVDWYSDKYVYGDIESGIYDSGFLPVSISYEAIDHRQFDEGDYFTAPSCDGYIDVKYHVEVFDEDGIGLFEFTGKFQTR